MTNILITGVGGQGILLASEILCEAALAAGHDVKKSEVHGMSQRGGSVNSHVRYGPEVHSALIPEGSAHFLLALEKLEALRWSRYLVPGGTVIVNDFRLDPATVTIGGMQYPGDVIERLREEGDRQVAVVDGPGLSVKAGDLRTMNTVMLGALSNFLDLDESCWQGGMRERIREKLLEINLEAFEMGKKAVRNGDRG